MISPPANTQIWIAAGVTDMRRGFTGLSALVQMTLEQAPLSVMCLRFVAGAAI
jgi:transposase